MSSRLGYPLEGEVHVDEFFIGGHEDKKPGRSKGNKRLVVLALEKLPEGVDRACARVITSASGKELKPFFRDHINTSANVITDQWNGYLPLKDLYPHLQQVPSGGGKNLSDVHFT